jgi:hypothetical protein
MATLSGQDAGATPIFLTPPVDFLNLFKTNHTFIVHFLFQTVTIPFLLIKYTQYYKCVYNTIIKSTTTYGCEGWQIEEKNNNGFGKGLLA